MWPGNSIVSQFGTRIISVFVLLSVFTINCNAQNFLDRQVSVSVKNTPVSSILELIGEQGGFRFSYNSDIISRDSLVSMSLKLVPVKQALNALLSKKYIYKEVGSYVIIHKAPRDQHFLITGQVIDAETQIGADYASVYSRERFVSALTDDSGFFRLRLKAGELPLILHVSKVGYGDTTIVIDSELNEGLKINISPKAIDLDTLVITNSNEKNSWLVRLFVSSRLLAQSRNLSKFFVSLPFQASLTPGLSTHGKLSTQITNKFSLNIYGGYTAGVNGVEIGGLFNISKKDSRYLQVATTFNAVWGNFEGVQMGGIYNQVLDSLDGLQVSGFGNFIRKTLKGVQLSSGVNVTKGNVFGAQVTVGGNVAGGSMHGVQLAGLFNYAKKMRGVQIGLINLADSSSGYSVGLVSVVKKGSGVISTFASELVPWNLAWKSGNSKLYNILTFGSSIDRMNKAYVLGFGFGRESVLYKNLSLNSELTAQTIYLGSWTHRPALYRLHTGLSLGLGKSFSLNAGPAISLLRSQQEVKTGYQSFTDKGFFRFSAGHSTHGWLGWQGGISWKYIRR